MEGKCIFPLHSEDTSFHVHFMKSQKENSKTGNSRSLDPSFIWKDAAGLISKELGKSVGSERIYVHLDTIPPGAFSTTYHSHSCQEEFFYIISGTGTLRLNDDSYSVGPDDFLAKPAGRNIAHSFYNSGREALCILDIGTVDPEDTCYYPDEQIYLHKSNGERRVYRADATYSDWSTAPNDHSHAPRTSHRGNQPGKHKKGE